MDDRVERRRSVTGLSGKAQVLEQHRPHRQGRGGRHARALVADEHRRIFLWADDEDGLLETWVEPGQVGEVCAVLTVGPHDEVVVASRCHRRAQPLHALVVEGRRQQWLRIGHPDVGQCDVRQVCPRPRRDHAFILSRSTHAATSRRARWSRADRRPRSSTARTCRRATARARLLCLRNRCLCGASRAPRSRDRLRP